MEINSSKTLKVISVALIFVLLMSMASQITRAADKAEKPTWKKGDDWFYSLTDVSRGNATIRLEVERTKKVEFKVDNNTYDCVRFSRTSKKEDANESETQFIYYKKSNYGEIAREVPSYAGRGYYFYNDSLERFNYPLKVGKEWSVVRTRYHQALGSNTGEEISQVNFQSEVTRKEKITVNGEEYNTYVVNTTVFKIDQKTGRMEFSEYAIFYYSEKVKNAVRIAEYNENGKLLADQKLISYNVTEVNNNSPSVGTIVFGTTTISMVALYNIVKKKKED